MTIGGVDVTGTTALVSFSSGATDVARFECSLDGGAFATCASPRQLTGLTAGTHSIAVRAIDRAGNTGTAVTQGFSVPAINPSSPPSDTKAPKVRPKPRTAYVSNKGKFKVSLRCPSTETRCRIALKVRYRRKDRGQQARHGRRRGHRARDAAPESSGPQGAEVARPPASAGGDDGPR